jgi:hypothetical protein
MRPVGPRGPVIYWVRRGVLILVVLVLVVLLAKACSGGGSSPTPAPSTHPTPTVTTSTSQSTAPTVTACSTSALTLTVDTDSSTYTAGQAPKLIGVFANNTSSACKLTLSPAEEIWTVKTGTALIWTTQGCAASTPAETVKIRAGATKMVSIFWPGYVQSSDCGRGAVASPGEYTLDATLDGVHAERRAVFQITS